MLSNTTRAEKTAEGFYRLVGHKWFFSVPQSDAHLVLAQAPAGLSCFFVPRLLPDGQRNGVRLERLKEKLGNRSNASSEVEFYEACGWLVGDEGDGVRQILRMGGLTRFDCALGSHALMRRAFSVALYHALQRQAFGKNLVEQPMMRQLLGQMALRLEGRPRFCFAWRGPGTVGMMPGKAPGRACLRLRPSLPSVRPVSRLSPRRWKCWAASAIARRANSRASTVRCRSTASGKAPAILCASM